MSNQGKWIINLVEDGNWNSMEEFDSKEEAIAYGKENFEEIYEEENGEKFNSETYNKVFYVGKIDRYVPSVDVDRVIENITENAYDEVGEFAEDYLDNVSKEEYGFLEEKMNEVLHKWLDETKNHPTFWKIVGVEKVIVTA